MEVGAWRNKWLEEGVEGQGGGRGRRNVPHEQRGRRASETQGRKREKESEIVQKSGRKSYSGNDVVAMATVSSDTPLHRCRVGIFKALH